MDAGAGSSGTTAAPADTAHEAVDDIAVEEFAGAIFTRFVGALEMLSVYVGDRLGLYRALLQRPGTVADLADRTGMHERYAREWLEQQAVAGILVVDDADAAADERRYSLPSAHAEVLA